MTPEGSAASARPCGICTLIERAASGNFADFVAELPQSWVILGDAQFYRGYCVMLAKQHATELHLMPPDTARALFEELTGLGHAVANVVKPLKLNYECLGNLEPHVHWHVFPRQAEDARRREPVWVRPEVERKVSLEENDRCGLIAALGAELGRLVPGARIR